MKQHYRQHPAWHGATGGRLFAAGRTGDVFTVPTPALSPWVEGIGDNGW